MRRILIAATMAYLLGGIPVYAYDLTVTSGAKGDTIPGHKSYTVPQGTSRVTLRYNIYSAEYPDRVAPKNIYNDTWSVIVTSDYGVLFNITRQVNSQLTQEPIWKTDGTTGDIDKTIDVSGLTVNGPANLNLQAISMNVKDDQLGTTVNSSLIVPPSAISIDGAYPDTINTRAKDVDFYSIPVIGGSNLTQRYFTLELSKEKNFTLKNITVTLVGDMSDLMKVVDHQAPVSGPECFRSAPPDACILAQTDTTVRLRVRVTILTPPLPGRINVPSAGNPGDPLTMSVDPVSTRTIAYRFNVEGETWDGLTDKASRTVMGLTRLWNAHNSVDNSTGRYGHEDAGGDGWASEGAIWWLVTRRYRGRFDDIAGEHSINIGHTEHAYGTDFDMYDGFVKNNVALGGTKSYERLRDSVVKAVSLYKVCNAMPVNVYNYFSSQRYYCLQNLKRNSLSYVDENSSWFMYKQLRLIHLVNDEYVQKVYTGYGAAVEGVLNKGWLEELVLTGCVTTVWPDQKDRYCPAYPLELSYHSFASFTKLKDGAWAKVKFLAGHDNHTHVGLDRKKLESVCLDNFSINSNAGYANTSYPTAPGACEGLIGSNAEQSRLDLLCASENGCDIR